jgi:hypothetical protein
MVADQKVLHSSRNWSDFKGTYMQLDELKLKLSDYIRQYSITKFDADDIIELISEGESIEWVIDQLKGGGQIDVDAVASLLMEIKDQVGAKEEAANDESAEPSIDTNVQTEAPIDPSQLDLSQIDSMLPEGMEMPAGMDMEKIKELMESPQGKVMADFAAFCHEKGIDFSGGNLNDPRMERLQKEWLSTPRNAFNGKTPSDMLSLAQEKVETVRRQNPRVGRNDPCPCGSGKKYKKCCGRE